MRSVRIGFGCALAVALLVNTGASRADTIVSNLNDTMNGSGTVYASGPPQTYAQEFLTGSQGALLGTVVVPLGQAVDSPAPMAELVTDNGGVPGTTVLATFTVPTIPTGTGNIADLTLTPSANPMLSANTDYWLVLSASPVGASSDTSYKWGYTNTNSPSFPHYAYSHDSGSTWTVETNGPFLLQVNSAAAVPEPTSLVLIALGLPVAYGVGARWKARLAGR